MNYVVFEDGEALIQIAHKKRVWVCGCVFITPQSQLLPLQPLFEVGSASLPARRFWPAGDHAGNSLLNLDEGQPGNIQTKYTHSSW